MRGSSKGLTPLETVMGILLILIIAAVAIPTVKHFTSGGKDSEVQKAVEELRGAVSAASAQIALKEDPSQPTPKFPTLEEMQKNAFTDSHPVLNGTPIFDPKTGIPKNPWTDPTLPSSEQNVILECNTAKPGVSKAQGKENRGWCYRQTTGEIWANTHRNGAEAGKGKSENQY